MTNYVMSVRITFSLENRSKGSEDYTTQILSVGSKSPLDDALSNRHEKMNETNFNHLTFEGIDS